MAVPKPGGERALKTACPSSESYDFYILTFVPTFRLLLIPPEEVLDGESVNHTFTFFFFFYLQMPY